MHTTAEDATSRNLLKHLLTGAGLHGALRSVEALHRDNVFSN
ncbi:MAG: hypothetical protein ACO2PN_16955 [Pyrobaculum sp.]|jgi:hypothetical protein